MTNLGFPSPLRRPAGEIPCVLDEVQYFMGGAGGTGGKQKGGQSSTSGTHPRARNEGSPLP